MSEQLGFNTLSNFGLELNAERLAALVTCCMSVMWLTLMGVEIEQAICHATFEGKSVTVRNIFNLDFYV